MSCYQDRRGGVPEYECCSVRVCQDFKGLCVYEPHLLLFSYDMVMGLVK